jgi:hypothetical protein
MDQRVDHSAFSPASLITLPQVAISAAVQAKALQAAAAAIKKQ